VAFFSLLLLLLLGGLTRRTTPTQRWGFSGLGIAIVILVGVMLVSAFQRLVLYEAAYGFSRLRTYTHVFMFWLGGLLVVTAVLETLRRERAFALAAVLAALGFAASLPLLNVDGFIVRQNVARAAQGGELDVPYLVSLSTDAVPPLVKQYRSPDLPDRTREAAGAALVCIQQDMAVRSPDSNWRSFTLAHWWGEKAMQSVKNDLENYQITEDEWPPTVTTPSGDQYECWTSRD
jgi:hypothetical protein